MRGIFSSLLRQVILVYLGYLKMALGIQVTLRGCGERGMGWGREKGETHYISVSCLELPVPEPEEQSRPRKPTLQPVLQLKARRRLDKVSKAPHQSPEPRGRHGSCPSGAS